MSTFAKGAINKGDLSHLARESILRARLNKPDLARSSQDKKMM